MFYAITSVPGEGIEACNEVSSCKPSLDNLPVGYGRSWNLSLEPRVKLRLKLFHFDHLWLVGMLGGGMGSMTRSSIHWRHEPASQSTKCSEETSPGRTMASPAKMGKHLVYTWRGGLPGLHFTISRGISMFFQGTCFFLFGCLGSHIPVDGVHTVGWRGWRARREERKRGFQADPFGKLLCLQTAATIMMKYHAGADLDFCSKTEYLPSRGFLVFWSVEGVACGQSQHC